MPLTSTTSFPYSAGVVADAGSREVRAGVREARRQRPRGSPMDPPFVAALFDFGGKGGKRNATAQAVGGNLGGFCVWSVLQQEKRPRHGRHAGTARVRTADRGVGKGTPNGRLEKRTFCSFACEFRKVPRGDIERSLDSQPTQFRYHYTNTEASPDGQAGTGVPAQPLAASTIDSLLNKQRSFRMSNADQTENRNFEQHQNGKERIDAADASTNAFPGGFQAIATAYGDYTKKSFEDTKSFVEKLSGVRSFDKAVEVQTEFAKSAFETFVTESQKIGALYGDLAKQAYKPFGGFLTKMTPTA
jgi:hypothetical protein